MAERKISGPISAIGSSSVRLATLVAGGDSMTEHGGGARATKAIAVPGAEADLVQVMDRIRERAAEATPFEDFVDVTHQLHRDVLEGEGFKFDGDSIDEGPDPDPGSDTGLSLQIFDLLRSGQKLLGPLNDDQRRGLGLVARAFVLQGRLSVAHHDRRLIRAAENGAKSSANGRASARHRSEETAERYADAVRAALLNWDAGEHIGTPSLWTAVGMARHLKRQARFAILGERRLSKALREHAPQK